MVITIVYGVLCLGLLLFVKGLMPRVRIRGVSAGLILVCVAGAMLATSGGETVPLGRRVIIVASESAIERGDPSKWLSSVPGVDGCAVLGLRPTRSEASLDNLHWQTQCPDQPHIFRSIVTWIDASSRSWDENVATACAALYGRMGFYEKAVGTCLVLVAVDSDPWWTGRQPSEIVSDFSELKVSLERMGIRLGVIESGYGQDLERVRVELPSRPLPAGQIAAMVERFRVHLPPSRVGSEGEAVRLRLTLDGQLPKTVSVMGPMPISIQFSEIGDGVITPGFHRLEVEGPLMEGDAPDRARSATPAKCVTYFEAVAASVSLAAPTAGPGDLAKPGWLMEAFYGRAEQAAAVLNSPLGTLVVGAGGAEAAPKTLAAILPRSFDGTIAKGCLLLMQEHGQRDRVSQLGLTSGFLPLGNLVKWTDEASDWPREVRAVVLVEPSWEWLNKHRDALGSRIEDGLNLLIVGPPSAPSPEAAIKWMPGWAMNLRSDASKPQRVVTGGHVFFLPELGRRMADSLASILNGISGSDLQVQLQHELAQLLGAEAWKCQQITVTLKHEKSGSVDKQERFSPCLISKPVIAQEGLYLHPLINVMELNAWPPGNPSLTDGYGASLAGKLKALMTGSSGQLGDRAEEYMALDGDSYYENASVVICQADVPQPRQGNPVPPAWVARSQGEADRLQARVIWQPGLESDTIKGLLKRGVDVYLVRFQIGPKAKSIGKGGSLEGWTLLPNPIAEQEVDEIWPPGVLREFTVNCREQEGVESEAKQAVSQAAKEVRDSIISKIQARRLRVLQRGRLIDVRCWPSRDKVTEALLPFCYTPLVSARDRAEIAPELIFGQADSEVKATLPTLVGKSYGQGYVVVTGASPFGAEVWKEDAGAAAFPATGVGSDLQGFGIQRILDIALLTGQVRALPRHSRVTGVSENADGSGLEIAAWTGFPGVDGISADLPKATLHVEGGAYRLDMTKWDAASRSCLLQFKASVGVRGVALLEFGGQKMELYVDVQPSDVATLERESVGARLSLLCEGLWFTPDVLDQVPGLDRPTAWLGVAILLVLSALMLSPCVRSFAGARYWARRLMRRRSKERDVQSEDDVVFSDQRDIGVAQPADLTTERVAGVPLGERLWRSGDRLTGARISRLMGFCLDDRFQVPPRIPQLRLREKSMSASLLLLFDCSRGMRWDNADWGRQKLVVAAALAVQLMGRVQRRGGTLRVAPCPWNDVVAEPLDVVDLDVLTKWIDQHVGASGASKLGAASPSVLDAEEFAEIVMISDLGFPGAAQLESALLKLVSREGGVRVLHVCDSREGAVRGLCWNVSVGALMDRSIWTAAEGRIAFSGLCAEREAVCHRCQAMYVRLDVADPIVDIESAVSSSGVMP